MSAATTDSELDPGARARAALACRLCGGGRTRVFFELSGVPVQDGRLWPTPEAASSAPVGDIRLVFCAACGFVANEAFEPEKVQFGEGYDISLHHSPLYRAFVGSVAGRLIERHDVRGKTVLEIACGNGDFLREICRRGGNRGIGFDPSLREADIRSAAHEGVALRSEPFPGRSDSPPADLVCCRHVIQSVPSPREFVSAVRASASRRPGSVVYFETSNAATIFRDLEVWTIIYETCSYYTVPSLTRLFELEGFRVLEAAPCFDGRYVSIDARVEGDSMSLRETTATQISELDRAVTDFAGRFEREHADWSKEIARWRGRRVAAWGAGGRAICFLSLFGLGAEVPLVVDINPCRQGAHLPGTAQRVGPPEALIEFRPEVLLITSPVFEAEIRAQLAQLGIACEIRTL